MTETQQKPQRAQEALLGAVSSVLEMERRLGQHVVICRNGRPVRLLRPEQLREQGND